MKGDIKYGEWGDLEVVKSRSRSLEIAPFGGAHYAFLFPW